MQEDDGAEPSGGGWKDVMKTVKKKATPEPKKKKVRSDAALHVWLVGHAYPKKMT